MPQQASFQTMTPDGAQAARPLVLGLGCERGTAPGELVALCETLLARIGRSADAVALVATLDVRADEPAMQAVARHYGVPLVTFDASRLEAETPRLANPSSLVFTYTGCHGVAEAAALAGAGAGGRLLVEKTKSAHATAAIGESLQPLAGAPSGSDSVSSHFDSSGERL